MFLTDADAAALTWFTVCFFGKRGLDRVAGVLIDLDADEMVGGRIADDLCAGRDEGGGGIGDSLASGRARKAGGGIGDCLMVG